MRIINRTIVSALIFSKDEKLFMGQKDLNKGGVYTDCWHIPGGGVENDEDKIDALVREINEETGIDISNFEIKLIDDQEKGSSEKVLTDGERVICEMEFNVYKIQLSLNSEDVEIKLSDDLVLYKWFNVSDLKNQKLTPPSVKLFGKLGYF